MKNALDKSDPESHGEIRDLERSDVVAHLSRDDPTTSGTEVFVVRDSQDSVRALTETGSEVDEREKTIISQRPVAAPEEFYKSMPLADLAAMLEGKRLDHFQVEQMIGGGGMGAVFRGRDERLDRTVAIKVIPAAKRDPETLRRFRLEAQAAARLDHPNIARVYYVGEADQWNYIVFEFIDGVNIRDLVAMEGPLSVDDAVFYTRQIAEALCHAHERAVVHRDIKPSNILVTAGGVAKVVDMGLARNNALDKSTADATASGITLGTFDYISPEQARDPRDADVRSDLYSLGCSLFFMLTGHPPFPEGTALQKLLNHGSQPPPDPRGWRDDLSDQLYEIVMKLMAKQPGNRYQKPAELINDLMLLAKLEELPRSQLPGTMMITPTVAQRSLLETNLPWMVAFAFLLGSTLWLRSVQAIADGYTFPELPSKAGATEFSAPASASDAQATVNQPVEQMPVPEAASTVAQPPANLNALAMQPPSELGENPAVLFGTGALAGPSLKEPAVDLATGDESTAGPGLNLAPSTLGRILQAPIVVSEFRPADVKLDRWESNIARAIQQLDANQERLEIELRGRVVLSKPLSLAGRELVIRGAPETSPRIEIAPELFDRLDDWSGAFELRDASLGLHGVGIRAAPSGIVRQRKIAIFDLEGESNLVLTGSSLTISAAAESARSMFAVLVDEKPPSFNSFATESMATHTTTITAIDTAFRGQASWLGARIDPGAYHRVGVGLTNSLLALEGVALEVARAVDSQNSVSRQIRLVCRQSTFLTQDGFAVLDFTGPSAPLFSLNRTSDNCIFASSRSEAHILLQGSLSPGLLGDMPWLLLKGNDNAYDANVSAITACRDRNGSITKTFGFNEATQESWFDERGTERRIPWVSEPLQTTNLAQSTLADYRVRQDGFFSPGVEESSDFPGLE